MIRTLLFSQGNSKQIEITDASLQAKRLTAPYRSLLVKLAILRFLLFFKVFSVQTNDPKNTTGIYV